MVQQAERNALGKVIRGIQGVSRQLSQASLRRHQGFNFGSEVDGRQTDKCKEFCGIEFYFDGWRTCCKKMRKELLQNPSEPSRFSLKGIASAIGEVQWSLRVYSTVASDFTLSSRVARC